jgi:hypothetical protein
MRQFSEPKRRAIGEEINRLRKAGFIRELKEAEWVATLSWCPKMTPPLCACDDGKMAATKITNVRVHVIETDSM